MVARTLMQCICFRILEDGSKEFLNKCGSKLCKKILSKTINGVPFERLEYEIKSTDQE